VFIELKTPEIKKTPYGKARKPGVQSRHQIAFEQAIKEHGGEYFIVRSIDEAMQLFPHPWTKGIK
jgi:hypothetical protein